MQSRKASNLVDYAAMGKRIRKARKEKRMTQNQVAQLCDISAAFFGHIERGTRVASVETLIMIARVLQVSLDVLVNDPNAGYIPQTHTVKVSDQISEFDYGDEKAPDPDTEFCYIRIPKSRLEALKKVFTDAGISLEEKEAEEQ